MIGYLRNNRYENAYGTPIKCFKCGKNKCNGTKSFSMPFGGNGELIHCEEHESDARIEVNRRDGNVTILSTNTSAT